MLGHKENPLFALNDPYGLNGCSVGTKNRPVTAVPISKPPRSQVSQMTENKQKNGSDAAASIKSCNSKPPMSVHSAVIKSEIGGRSLNGSLA